MPFLILLSTLTTLLIWFPFGFHLNGLVEEWGILNILNQTLFWAINFNSPIQLHILRPFFISPYTLAYILNPNSYFIWHILLIISLIIKSSAWGSLIWQATKSHFCAFTVALLTLLYPADTMQLCFRSLSINLALSLMLFSSAIFIYGYNLRSTIHSYIIAFLASFLYFISICMYEIGLFLIFLPLLILFIQTDFKNFFYNLKLNFKKLTIWFCAGFFYLIYVLYIFFAPNKTEVIYQNALLGESPLQVFLSSWQNIFKIGLLRSLIGGWYDALQITYTQYANYYYLITATIFILSFYLINIAKEKTFHFKYNSFYFKIIISALLLIIFGYLPFLFVKSHQIISQRTFIFATPGAALFWTAILYFLLKKTKIIAVSCFTFFVFFGLSAQIFQMEHYIQISEKQRLILKGIIENVQKEEVKDKTLVIIDESNDLGHTWLLGRDMLTPALGYFYDTQVMLEICHSPSMEWQFTAQAAQKGKCAEAEDEWLFYLPNATDSKKIAKQKSILIKIDSMGNISSKKLSLGYKDFLETSNTPIAIRYRNILLPKAPQNQMFFQNKEKFHWSFGNWWSLELPIKGSGWREAEWQVNYFHHKSVSWKNSEKSDLFFILEPSNKSYKLTANFPVFINSDIKKSLTIIINNQIIPYSWISAETLTAKIPIKSLRSGLNHIEFNSEVDNNYYGLAAQMAFVDISPVNFQ